jgi:3-methyladenine DNA glycosylase/8-oxoguanine DNA glycosylase
MARARNLRKTSELRVGIPEPFDFELTVAKPAGWNWCSPGEKYRDGVLWGGFYLADGPIGLKLQRSGSKVEVEVFSDRGGPDVEPGFLRHAVECGLGKNVDMEAFYRFSSGDPVLAKAVEDLYGMRPGRLDDVFGRVILAITLQMAQIKRSRAMMSDILENYGTRLLFDDQVVTLWPPIQRIAALPEEELREKANMGYRAKLLRAAAVYLAEHPVNMLELDDMDEDQALKTVRGIPGIGEYSAGIVMGRSDAPVDAWSVIIMSELLMGTTPEKPRQEIGGMNAMLKERWGKWAWLSFVYIINDLANLSQIYHLSRLS